MASPLIMRALSEARKTQRSATSSGSISRSIDLVGNDFAGHHLEADAPRIGLALDDAVDAVAPDAAGADGVAADIVTAKLDGERLGEADHRPFRRRIGHAVAEAEETGIGQIRR